MSLHFTHRHPHTHTHTNPAFIQITSLRRFCKNATSANSKNVVHDEETIFCISSTTAFYFFQHYFGGNLFWQFWLPKTNSYFNFRSKMERQSEAKNLNLFFHFLRKMSYFFSLSLLTDATKGLPTCFECKVPTNGLDQISNT